MRCVWFLGRRPGPRRRPPPFLSRTHTHVQQALAVLRAQGGEDVGQDEADGCDGKGGERREREVDSEGGVGCRRKKKRAGCRARPYACPPLPPPTPSDRVRWQGRAAPHPGGVVGGHGGASEGGRGAATRGGGGRCGRAKQSKKKKAMQEEEDGCARRHPIPPRHHPYTHHGRSWTCPTRWRRLCVGQGEGGAGRGVRAGVHGREGARRRARGSGTGGDIRPPSSKTKRTDHVDARRKDLGHSLILVRLEAVDDDLREEEGGEVGEVGGAREAGEKSDASVLLMLFAARALPPLPPPLAPAAPV